MAKTLFKLTTIFSMLIILSLHYQISFSTDTENEEDFFELDTPLPHLISRSRFLATTIKKGAKCNPSTKKNICNGVSAKKGSEFLQCCKKTCADVLGDINNCGKCGKRCNKQELCCSGKCTNILHNVNNCGKCNKKCKRGIKCSVGFCGYA
ncbi:PREDICTED: protein GRIM REAPER-like [Lupinus angustifolius]|uniref:protein GRIM REAPER-like n=1 Tax=Lupinus angustifolius TaxID=3871 RepID=UPI00092EEF85|nr:PREDICTED: protein GRIM REAPER-like [Lupinus angustifolius]